MRGEILFFKTGAPGWAEVFFAGDHSPERILIKISSRDGRWIITNLIMVGDIDSSLLKSIPMSRIEAALNSVGMGAQLSDQTPDSPPRQADSFHAEFEQIDSGLTAYLSKHQKVMVWADNLETPLQVHRPPLVRPDGSDPEAFYRQVAKAYDDVVRKTAAPAKVLANEAGVPVATVHRWIHEARRRGYLPPARKGRAG